MNISPIIRGHQKNCFLVYSISHIGWFQKPLKNSSDFGFNLVCFSFTIAMSSHSFSAVYLHQSCMRFTFKILDISQNFKTFAKYLTNSEFLKIVNMFKMSSFTLFFSLSCLGYSLLLAFPCKFFNKLVNIHMHTSNFNWDCTESVDY